MLADAETTLAEQIDAALAEKPDGILETVASKCGVSLLRVLQQLPSDQVRLLPGARFEDIWSELASWGNILMIVHTPDIVLECSGNLPSGSSGHGYFNIHGDSPMSGHIKASNCSAIALVDRLFHGRRSCSVQFINGAGGAMFKVFVSRDEERELELKSLDRFERLFGQSRP